MKNKLQLIQRGIGAMDACTGILLVIAPVWTLHLMGMQNIPTPADIISFVGVFVMAVGISYFLTSDRDLPGWKMQWKVTALVRLSVGCFLAWKIFGQGWEIRWVSVLLTDFSVAIFQLVGLKKGWLNHMKS